MRLLVTILLIWALWVDRRAGVYMSVADPSISTAPSIAHRTSHRRLVKPLPPGVTRSGRFDAVVVPAHRSVRHLRSAAQLAAETGWPLLLLCSHALDSGRA
jgi:hypothetical protein